MPFGFLFPQLGVESRESKDSVQDLVNQSLSRDPMVEITAENDLLLVNACAAERIVKSYVQVLSDLVHEGANRYLCW
jgi:hypothetical protein